MITSPPFSLRGCGGQVSKRICVGQGLGYVSLTFQMTTPATMTTPSTKTKCGYCYTTAHCEATPAPLSNAPTYTMSLCADCRVWWADRYSLTELPCPKCEYCEATKTYETTWYVLGDQKKETCLDCYAKSNEGLEDGYAETGHKCRGTVGHDKCNTVFNKTTGEWE